MSGLAVLFNRDGRPVDPHSIWEMLWSMPYRGLDGCWVTTCSHVALGFAKLTTCPEDTNVRQPLQSPRTGCVIIADSRLDNRAQLSAELTNTCLANVSDAELILRAYETWSEKAPTRLLGDFAFVIWDPRSQCLFCARDTSGQRSLFYRADLHGFAAGSEIQQLLQDPAVPVRPNEERVREYLTPYWTYQNEKQGAATYYEGIWSLPPGHVLVVSASSLKVKRYWELRRTELRYRTDDEYAEHYFTLLSDAVRARLRAVRPIGVLLSGGLDSSSIAAVAQLEYRSGRLMGPRVSTFTSAFDGLDCDERPLIDELQQMYGLKSNFVPCGAFAGRLEPSPSGFHEAPNMGVSEARDAILGSVHRSGIRVVLSGDTADACVAGTRLVLDSLLRQRRFGEFWNHLQPLRRSTGESWAKILTLYCLFPLLPLTMHRTLMATYLRRTHRHFRARLLPTWMPEALRTELSERHVNLLLEAEHARRYASPTREHEYRLLYPPEVARPLVPWPIEKWTPFTDRRLHEFLLAIPPDRKFAPHPNSDNLYAGQKQLVRRAMRGILPESIRTRTLKTHFRAVWENELTQQWPAYQAIFGSGKPSNIEVRGLVNADRFWTRLQELKAGEYGVDFLYVMNLVSLETWLRRLSLSRPQLVTVAPPWQQRESHMNEIYSDSQVAPIRLMC